MNQHQIFHLYSISHTCTTPCSFLRLHDGQDLPYDTFQERIESGEDIDDGDEPLMMPESYRSSVGQGWCEIRLYLMTPLINIYISTH